MTSAYRTRSEIRPKTTSELLTFIISYGKEVFTNLWISLQILLTIAVSIATCERSFSKLKLILTYLRASMGQDRLSDLALLSVGIYSVSQKTSPTFLAVTLESIVGFS